jgi:8-amino-7-oxononanoate synthase
MNAESRRIEALKSRRRYRTLSLPSGIDFASNDYLGFASHPALRAAAADAMAEEGLAGAGGSRLLRGHHEAHARLEEYAAGFFGTERTLFFNSGFDANFALFSTLPSRHDAVVFDERIHASAKEGMRAALAKRYRARHNDAQCFEDEIKRARALGARRVFVAVESVYSMDGDLAPLAALDRLVRRHDATLVVDEAHATGVFGPTGRGAGEGMHGAHWISLHTCGKALGVAGALICAKDETIDLLINQARPFIYSTALPPFIAAMVKRALQLVDEDPQRRERLRELAPIAHRGLNGDIPFAGSQIVPVLLGEDEEALRVAACVQRDGFDVRAIRPPTVPEGTARLRVSIHANHGESEIASLAEAVKKAREQWLR